jgi:hypothetical protein
MEHALTCIIREGTASGVLGRRGCSADARGSVILVAGPCWRVLGGAQWVRRGFLGAGCPDAHPA